MALRGEYPADGERRERRRKTAAERREQRLRSDARAMNRWLRAFREASQHRGGRPLSAIATAVMAALELRTAKAPAGGEVSSWDLSRRVPLAPAGSPPTSAAGGPVAIEVEESPEKEAPIEDTQQVVRPPSLPLHAPTESRRAVQRARLRVAPSLAAETNGFLEVGHVAIGSPIVVDGMRWFAIRREAGQPVSYALERYADGEHILEPVDNDGTAAHLQRDLP